MTARCAPCRRAARGHRRLPAASCGHCLGSRGVARTLPTELLRSGFCALRGRAFAQHRREDSVHERGRLGTADASRSRPPRRSRPRAAGTSSGYSSSASPTRRIERSSGAIRSRDQPLAWVEISSSNSGWWERTSSASARVRTRAHRAGTFIFSFGFAGKNPKFFLEGDSLNPPRIRLPKSILNFSQHTRLTVDDQL